MDVARLEIVLAIDRARQQVNALQADLMRLDQVSKIIGRRISDSLNDSLTRANTNARALNATFAQLWQTVGTGAARFGQNLAPINNNLSSMDRLLQGIGRRMIAAFGAVQLFRFGQEAVRASIDFERIENVLKLVTGSAEEAAEQFKFLRSESQRIGVSFRDTADRFARFEAAARGTGISVEQLKQTFIAVAEAGRRFGLSTSDQNRIFLALEQMVSKGVVSMEELRRQLGDALPGAFNIAARSMGMTGREFNKLVESGGLMTKDFLGPFTRELAKMAPAGATVASTAAEINRLKNAWDAFLASVGKSIPVKTGAKAATGLIEAFTPRTADEQAFAEERLQVQREMAARYGTGAPGSLQTESESGLFRDAATIEVRRRQILRDRFSSGLINLRNIGTSVSDSFSDAFRPQVANEQQTKKFQAEFDKLNQRGLSGRADIIASYAAEETRVKTLGLTYQQTAKLLNELRAAEQRELAEFDRKSEAEDAERLTDAYRQNQEMLSRFTIEALDPSAQAAAKVNEEFRKYYETLIVLDEAGADVTDTIKGLNAAQAASLERIANRRNRAGFTGESVSELRAGIRAGELGLLTEVDRDKFNEISQAIMDRSSELARRMKADATTVKEAWSIGWDEQLKSFGSFSERVATVGSGVAESLDRNFTDAFTSMITGTKSVAEAFSNMATSIVSDLVRIMVQQMIVRTVIQGLGFGFSQGGSFEAGTGGTGAGSTIPTDTPASMSGIGHVGAVLGGVNWSRNVPHGTFKRFHVGGVLGDEMPFVGRAGEVVFSPEQMGALGKVIAKSSGGKGNGASRVTVVNAMSPNEVTEQILANPDVILNVISRKNKQVKALLA